MIKAGVGRSNNPDAIKAGAEAAKEALVHHHQLIRETRCSDSTWQYQLLLGFANPLEE